MALHEERNEQNQSAWRAHFERERVDLSASVEATLMDTAGATQHWLDEFDEPNGSQAADTGRTALVPPRLSLQSRPVPVVQPERMVTATTNTQQMQASYDTEKDEQRSVATSQHSGVLTRLARRFTSSFAAVKPETLQSQEQALTSAPEFTQDMEMSPLMPDNRAFSGSVEYSHMPLVRVIDTTSSSLPIVEARRPEPKKRRSLKRNAKVRLETTELPVISKTAKPSKVEEQETGEASLADVRDALDRQQASAIVSTQKREQSDTQLSAVARVSLSGSGVVECGQREVTVSNMHVTAASIVLVTLTTNPGPVVIQYISLQPQIGFTVHLTAPVSMHTTFNYVVMLGEIF